MASAGYRGGDSRESLCPGVPGREGAFPCGGSGIRCDESEGWEIAMLTHRSWLLVAALALAVPAAVASPVAAAAGTRPQSGPLKPTLVLQANHPAPSGVRARPVG